MDNQVPQNQSTPPLSSASHGPRWGLVLLAGFLVFFIAFVAIYYASTNTKKAVEQPSNQSDPTNSTIPSAMSTQTSTSWVKPISTQKGFPIRKIGTQNEPLDDLYIYSFSTKKLEKAASKVGGGGGASDMGDFDPIPSPNLFYTTYIDNTDNNLWLLSHETLQGKQITSDGGVSFISSWSPDSTKIIYVKSDDTITGQTQGQGGIPTGTVTFKKGAEHGFFVFDITTGTTTKLYPVEYFESFIDNSRILVRTSDLNSTTNTRLIVFNIDTFTADYSFVTEEFGYGNEQFSIAPDGKKWTFTLSRNPTTDANIIYTNFPKKEGELIDTGAWADVQRPLISPDGTRLMYAKREGNIRDGVPNTVTWLYDAITKEKKRQIPGWPNRWIDNNSFIVREQHSSINDNSYYMVDIITGSSTKIY